MTPKHLRLLELCNHEKLSDEDQATLAALAKRPVRRRFVHAIVNDDEAIRRFISNLRRQEERSL